MTSYNNRKEPTFGSAADDIVEKITPDAADDLIAELENSADQIDKPLEQKASEVVKGAISLRTTKAPDFTFSPTLQWHTALDSTLQKSKTTPSDDVEKTALQTKQKESLTPEPNIAVTAEETVATQENNSMQNVEENKPTVEKETLANNDMERVVPAAAQAKNWNKPEEWKALNKVPSKHRRLVVVILLALLLGGLLYWLKPSTPETVEELQQSNNLPIEFRPVNEEEAKAAEAKLAEEKALAEKAAQEAAQQAQASAQQPAQAAQQPSTEQAVTSAENNATPATAEENKTVAVQAPKPAVQQPAQTAKAVESKPAEKAQAKPAQPKPVVKQEPIAPKSQGSVIYQPEKAKAPETKTTETKAAETKAVEVKKAEPKVVEAKPAPAVKAEVAKAAAAPKVAATSSKSMSVPAGVSLMQVFRNHNLNISDVNAMSKATGANNVLSSLKVGDSVNVRLDSNNRVVEMRLSSGGTFTRQANGTYSFKK